MRLGSRRMRLRCLPWLIMIALSGLSGCVALPPRPELASSDTSPVVAPPERTSVGQTLRASQAPEGLSGLRVLADPLDAFAARMALIRQAEHRLDLQYYIWRPDTTGTLMLGALREAADRGVKVRLLLDDNGIGGMDDLLAAIDRHPQIEVRLFNPFPIRWFKPLSYLGDFGRLNRRMHNKAFIADSTAAIVGGRNIGDAYFGADDLVDFADLDVLTTGAVVPDVLRSFLSYWDSPLAYPLSSIGSRHPVGQDPLTQRLATLRHDEQTLRYRDAVKDSSVARDLGQGKPDLEWVRIRLLADPPEKASGQGLPQDWLVTGLQSALGEATQSVDLISPYFVPGEQGTALLGAYPARGVALRVVTNSLAATDVVAVHPGYARRRLDLLKAGVTLYELKAVASDVGARPWNLSGSSTASLHGKAFAVDGQRAFVGSFNIDPRSVSLNTEMGLVIESPTLARTLTEALDRDLPQHAYRVRLGPGDRLEWTEQTPAGTVVHHHEPDAGWWKRFMAWLMAWPAIEGLL